MEKKKLKRYKVIIDPDDEYSGMSRISIVDRPAIEIKSILLNKDNIEQIKFTADKEKKILLGPAIIADKDIIRYDSEEDEHFYIFFSKEEIEKIVNKFNKNSNNFSINFNHEDVMVNGYITESWIVEDLEYDKFNKYGFKDITVGSWMIAVKIEDESFWESYVKKGYDGFSIEIFPSDLELMEFFVASGSVDSSNVNQYRYDSETEILFITFNDGSTYKYYNVAFGEFMDIRDGNAMCISEGSNQYGSWFVGKTPSVGAAVYVYLVAAGKRFERSAFNSIYEVLDFMTDDEIKESLESFVIEPIAGENEDEFIGRCMAIETNSYPNDQAYAICISKWEKK
jgi:hypothetical protein